MPYRDPSPDDPNVLVGVSVPGNREAMRAMAIAFAEEFAALGFDDRRLLTLFRLPGYQAAHQAYLALGEVEIRRIVAESLDFWRHYRVSVHEAAPDPAAGRDLVQLTPPSGRDREPSKEERDGQG